MNNKTLIVLLGTYGSGKTTFARHYAATHNAVYLDVDVLGGLDNQTFDYGVFLMRLQGVISGCQQQTFIMDGAPATVAMTDTLQAELGFTVRYWVCFASPETIRERQRSKRNTKDRLPHRAIRLEMMGYYLAVLATSKDPGTVFVDTSSCEYRQYSFAQWLPYWLEMCFLARYPRSYQDVRLRHSERAGHSESFKTWERLTSIYDFTGKNIIDYGTGGGYFLFKAEDAGAGELMGIDCSSFNAAREAAAIRGSRVAFQTADLNTFSQDKVYDCALCLNVLHHIDDKQALLSKQVFATARDVLFETPRELCGLIEREAIKAGYHRVCLINSHRYGRVVMLYSDHRAAFTPDMHVYTWGYYQRQRIRKWAFERRRIVKVAGKVLRLLGLYHPVYRMVMRKGNETGS